MEDEEYIVRPSEEAINLFIRPPWKYIALNFLRFFLVIMLIIQSLIFLPIAIESYLSGNPEMLKIGLPIMVGEIIIIVASSRLLKKEEAKMKLILRSVGVDVIARKTRRRGNREMQN